MKYCKVVAIINITEYEEVSDSLSSIVLPGVTVTSVKGFGDYVNEYSTNGFSDSLKIEIYTTEDQAIEIANILKDEAKKNDRGWGHGCHRASYQSL